MLRIAQVEEIADLLLLLPDLIQKQEQQAVDFVPRANVWLNSLERVLTSNRLYQAGTIAMLRSGLVAAVQGRMPAGIEFRGRPTRSRVLNATASRSLQSAAEVASALIAENQPRFAEAERVAQQIASVARSRGFITPREEEVGNTRYLRALRYSLGSSNELDKAFVHLEGLVGLHDALILFDRALVPLLGVSSRPVPDETFT